MPRARSQYIEEMRDRFEVNVAGRRVDRSYNASIEEKATLTAAAQVLFNMIFRSGMIQCIKKLFCLQILEIYNSNLLLINLG